MAALPSATGGSLLVNFASLPRLSVPASVVATAPAPNLKSAPSLPQLCRDTTHDAFCSLPAHAPYAGGVFLSLSTHLPGGKNRSLTLRPSDAGDFMWAHISNTYWAEIRDLLTGSLPSPPSSISIKLPQITYRMTSAQLVNFALSHPGTHSFLVPADYRWRKVTIDSNGLSVQDATQSKPAVVNVDIRAPACNITFVSV